MENRKKEILNTIYNCPNIVELFGESFLDNAIESYKTIDKIKWSSQNYFIANYFMSASFYLNQINFINSFEKLLSYFITQHKNYISSKNVLFRLTSKNEALFQGKWSELIFVYFLKNSNVDVISVSELIKTNEGEKELYDIKTKYGEIEVTSILSSKGKVFDSEEVFFGSVEIGEIEKQLVNRKIKNKSGKKILAIDCTFVDELYEKLFSYKEGLNIDFDVFKPTSKDIFLFLRNPANQQVGFCKYLNHNESLK